MSKAIKSFVFDSVQRHYCEVLKINNEAMEVEARLWCTKACAIHALCIHSPS